LIELANSQGHEISDVKNLHDFSEMARVPTHLSFGKPADEASYSKCLFKQDSADAYLAQV